MTTTYRLKMIFNCGEKYVFTKKKTKELEEVTGTMKILGQIVKHNIDYHNISKSLKLEDLVCHSPKYVI